MKITRITFYNYKNLSGLTLDFDLNCNFFVGENSIGKSNALRAIRRVYSCTNFTKQDFFDLTLLQNHLNHFIALLAYEYTLLWIVYLYTLQVVERNFFIVTCAIYGREAR